MNNNILDDSWDELIKAFDQGLVSDSIIEPIEYRIYYNGDGDIIKTTCLQKDEIVDENYIVVDELVYKEFLKDLGYKVINKKLQKVITNVRGYKKQLIQSESGFRVVKNQPALLLEENEEYQFTEYYNYRDD